MSAGGRVGRRRRSYLDAAIRVLRYGFIPAFHDATLKVAFIGRCPRPNDRRSRAGHGAIGPRTAPVVVAACWPERERPLSL